MLSLGEVHGFVGEDYSIHIMRTERSRLDEGVVWEGHKKQGDWNNANTGSRRAVNNATMKPNVMSDVWRVTSRFPSTGQRPCEQRGTE